MKKEKPNFAKEFNVIVESLFEIASLTNFSTITWRGLICDIDYKVIISLDNSTVTSIKVNAR